MNKLEKLKQNLSKYKSAVLAFSGGVDSTFLAKVASEVYGEKLLLITATSSTYPFAELEEAKLLAKTLNVKHQIITSEEIEIPGFSNNPPDRCYFCKSELFTLINHIAKEKGYDAVFDGSNYDDDKDFRPGKKALKELGIISPLADAELTKDEIRKYSKQYNLSTADKPAYACLASRFPYGEKITIEKLDRVGKAEHGLRNLGFVHFRVRSHENLARIEFAPNEIDKGWQKREEVERICKNAGYNYIAIDTKGYRTGAMNEVLNPDDIKKVLG